MKHLKNQNGSILALVVVMMGVLSILGTTLLSATLANFKMQIANTNMKSNLYIAEAGFEETYSKIYNIVSESMKKANLKAKDELQKYDDELFQNTVFLIENEGHSIDEYDYMIEVNGEFKYNEQIINQMAEDKFTDTYKSNVIDEINKLIINNKIQSDINPEVDITANTDLTFGTNGLEIDLVSKYTANNIPKTASTSLYVEVPIYNEPYTVAVSSTEIPVNPLWTKVLATDGNLIINSPTEINGDVYIKNNAKINNIGNITGSTAFINDLVVLGEINLSDNVDMSLTDVYANDLILAGENTKLTVNSSGDEASGIYIKDDFAMNNTKQNVVFNGNYYGFSDGSTSPDSDSSSAILINSSDIESGGSSLTINGDLYLLGTSYIGKEYQTGESISVKGNYLAYTEPLENSAITPSLFLTDNILFNYYDNISLYLADEFVNTEDDRDKMLNVDDKNKYFYYYYLENKDSNRLKLDNITVTGNYKTLGNIITGNKVNIGLGKSIISDLDEFKQKEKEYVNKTKLLGDSDIQPIDKHTDSSIYATKDIRFEGGYYNNTISGIHYIYNPDADRTIEINLNSLSTYYCFIVTNGDVVINAGGNLSGCIISTKNITISNTSSNIPVFKYNESVVLRGLAGIDAFKSIFLTKEKYTNYKLKHYSTEIYNGDSEDMVVNVDYSSLLKFRNWKINYE